MASIDSLSDDATVLQCKSAAQDPALGTCLKEYDHVNVLGGIEVWGRLQAALLAYGVNVQLIPLALEDFGMSPRAGWLPSVSSEPAAYANVCNQMSAALGFEVMPMTIEEMDSIFGVVTGSSVYDEADNLATMQQISSEPIWQVFASVEDITWQAFADTPEAIERFEGVLGNQSAMCVRD
ncbi:hypothetical protein ACBZ90_01330 (plasmid) [Vibrio alginolyticus]